MSESEASPVLAERHGPVMVLTLNRPAARNALNRALLSVLHDELHATVDDADIGAIVLTGAGAAFCAGADLKEATSTPKGADGFWTQFDRSNQSLELHRLLPKLAKPVIASDRARFGYPEVSKGLVAAMVMVSLSRIVGRRQALDLLLSGRELTPQDALALGMINRVAPHDELLPAAIAYANEVARNGASALRMTKLLYNHVVEMDMDRALDYARDTNLMLRQTRGASERLAAFTGAAEKAS